MLFLNSCEFHTFLIKKSQNFVQSMQGDEHTKDEHTNSHTNTHTNDNRPQLFSPYGAVVGALYCRGGRAFQRAVGDERYIFASRGCRPRTPAFLSQGLPPLDPATSLAMRPVVPAVASGRQLVPVVANWCQWSPTGARRCQRVPGGSNFNGRTQAHTGAHRGNHRGPSVHAHTLPTLLGTTTLLEHPNRICRSEVERGCLLCRFLRCL
jgi:hypothetical protein